MQPAGTGVAGLVHGGSIVDRTSNCNEHAKGGLVSTHDPRSSEPCVCKNGAFVAWECLHRFYVDVPGPLPPNLYVWQVLKGDIYEYRSSGSYRHIAIHEVEAFRVNAARSAGPDPHSWASPYPEFCSQYANLHGHLTLKIIKPLDTPTERYMSFKAERTEYDSSDGSRSPPIDESDWDPDDYDIESVPKVEGSYDEEYEPTHCRVVAGVRVEDTGPPLPGGGGTPTPPDGGGTPTPPDEGGGPPDVHSGGRGRRLES